jgi:signal transduction histidine kinase
VSTPAGVVRGTLRGRLLAIVAALLVLLIAVAASTLIVRLRVQAADNLLDRQLVPAHNAVTGLSRAYTDMQTGERGFVLTGDAVFLEPYDKGLRDAATLHRQMVRDLRDDATAQRLLRSVDTAATAWLDLAARPEISTRRNGTRLSGQALLAQSLAGKRLFDVLRDRLAALDEHVNARVTAEAGRARTAQGLANWVVAAAMVLALLVTIVSVFVLRRAFTRPLSRLVRQVGTVAAGDLDQPVEASGPAELAAVARAVDAMRTRILDDMAAAGQAREQIAMYAEGDRIARDLHDLVIQRLFAAGMRLESAAARQPELARIARETIDELDKSIRELRTVIFGLTAHQAAGGGVRERVISLVRDSERSLGFAPMVHFEGPVDVLTEPHVADELVPALGEMLSNVARHARASTAHVRLEATHEVLRVVVTDNGVGPPPVPVAGGRGLGNLRQRAQSLGGTCVVVAGESGGTVVEWTVPLAEPVGAASG